MNSAVEYGSHLAGTSVGVLCHALVSMCLSVCALVGLAECLIGTTEDQTLPHTVADAAGRSLPSGCHQSQPAFNHINNNFHAHTPVHGWEL